MKKIQPMTKEEVDFHTTQFSKMSSQEKDQVLALLYISVDRIAEILTEILKVQRTNIKRIQPDISSTNLKEIEEILSLGPKWLNYTRKIKKGGETRENGDSRDYTHKDMPNSSV